MPCTRPARLGLVTDRSSRHRCLLDTGSQVSLWPLSPASPNLQRANLRLTAANGTPIKAFGYERRQININGKSYSFMFLIAQVSRPILGLDFLQAFRMSIDLGRRQLIHSGICTRFSSTSSEISGVNVVNGPASSPFLRILDDFLEVLDASLATHTSRHGVECFINTKGPPIKTPPAFDAGKAAGSKTVLQYDDGGWHLSTFRFSVELRAPHGSQEGRNDSPVRRLQTPQRMYNRRCIPHSTCARLRVGPGRLYNIF